LYERVASAFVKSEAGDYATRPHRRQKGKEVMRKWVTKHPLFSFCFVAMAWVGLLYSGVIDAPFLDDDLSLIANSSILQSWHEVWVKYL